MHYDDFEDKLADLLDSDDLKKIETSRNKFNRRNLTAKELLTTFMDSMKKASLRNGY